MAYLTFVGQGRTRRLFRGVGADGDPLVEREGTPVQAFAAARAPVLWVSGREGDGGPTTVERLTLPDLTGAAVDWPGARVGALAAAPEGDRAAAIELPEAVGEWPRLRLWDGRAWQTVATEPRPDISSRLAWIDAGRLAYESGERRLTVVDLATSQTEQGPPGCCPAAATAVGEWFAVAAERVVRFPVDGGVVAPVPVEGIEFDDVASLSVTHDGQVFTWIEPGLLHRLKGYVQQRGGRRRRFRAIDAAIGAVLGPYEVA